MPFNTAKCDFLQFSRARPTTRLRACVIYWPLLLAGGCHAQPLFLLARLANGGPQRTVHWRWTRGQLLVVIDGSRKAVFWTEVAEQLRLEKPDLWTPADGQRVHWTARGKEELGIVVRRSKPGLTSEMEAHGVERNLSASHRRSAVPVSRRA